MNIHTVTTNHDVHQRTKIWAHSRHVVYIRSEIRAGEAISTEATTPRMGIGQGFRPSEPTCLIYFDLVSVF